MRRSRLSGHRLRSIHPHLRGVMDLAGAVNGLIDRLLFLTHRRKLLTPRRLRAIGLASLVTRVTES